MMVLITTAAGYFFGAQHVDWTLLLNTLIGTALVAAGTNALNQYIERDHDAKMRRTRLRPLPDGRISPRAALIFSIAISDHRHALPRTGRQLADRGARRIHADELHLHLHAAETGLDDLHAHRRDPRRDSAADGMDRRDRLLGAGGWIIFAHPLFLAASALHGHQLDVSRRLRPRRFRHAGRARRRRPGHGRAHAVFYSFALLTVSVLPPLFGLSTFIYLAGAVIAGAALTFASFAFLASRTPARARRLFMASNIYLIVMMALLVFA